MSYIQFESSREKEKIRQDLREAREQLLEKAKELAEQRVQREVRIELKGETNWMLPSVAEKFDKQSKKSEPSPSKKSCKLKKDKKKAKKSKKTSKKRKHSISNEDDSSTKSDHEWSEKKSRKKSKKKKKERSREYIASSSDSSEDSTDDRSAKAATKQSENKLNSKSISVSPLGNEGSEWIERPNVQKSPLQRDSWMTDTLILKTFSRHRPEKKPNNEKQQIDTYDPAKSTRELNPYWKSTGTGLPGFQKPTDEDDGKATNRGNRHAINVNASRNWRKKPSEKDTNTLQSKSGVKQTHVDCTSNSSWSSNENEAEAQPGKTEATETVNKFLTNQQMNELGAKILKAEIMGNMELAEQLKKKLENERDNRAAFKDSRKGVKNTIDMMVKTKRQELEGDKHILLTHTDERGNCRPLTQTRTASAAADPRELYCGRAGRKKQNKRVDTHVDGERVRYFPDDDKYDIKQMFEREKYSNAADSNLQFVNMASKHKNPNDDLDDIFADKIRKNISKEDTDKKEFQRAIYEHEKLASQLDKCTRCFDSERMDKKLLVSMGEKVYLALPWHVALQTGHCVIVPTQHISCSTQLDEDTWDEITNFRKALTHMFAAQRKDVVFFEIANKLNGQPHLSIHCVPIPEAQAEMTPFYFKKAIEESEREWSINKQLVSLRNKGLRSCIPKGLPYVWVNFGMDSGFAHVIEDQDRFPPNFAQEIIGGMLHLDVNKWRKPQREQNAIAKVKMFADWWKKYDCTN